MLLVGYTNWQEYLNMAFLKTQLKGYSLDPTPLKWMYYFSGARCGHEKWSFHRTQSASNNAFEKLSECNSYCWTQLNSAKYCQLQNPLKHQKAEELHIYFYTCLGLVHCLCNLLNLTCLMKKTGKTPMFYLLEILFAIILFIH